MSKSFRIVRAQCTAGEGQDSRYLFLTRDSQRFQCGCYSSYHKSFCRSGFEDITGVALPVDQPTYFRLVRVDDEPRPGVLRRVWDWLFQEGGPRG